jgi:hypothetical protein
MTFVSNAFALCHFLISLNFEILPLAECASIEVQVKVLVFCPKVIY